MSRGTDQDGPETADTGHGREPEARAAAVELERQRARFRAALTGEPEKRTA